MANGATRADNVKTASGLNVIAGIWLIAAPFFIGFADSSAAFWNSILIGVVVLVLAAIRVGNPFSSPGLSWINLVLGLWLIISPWVCGFSEFRGALWNNVVLGIIVALLAAWSASATHTPRQQMPRPV
jgi:hypothetical protein